MKALFAFLVFSSVCYADVDIQSSPCALDADETLIEGYWCVDQKSLGNVCVARVQRSYQDRVDNGTRTYEAFEAWMPQLVTEYRDGVDLMRSIVAPDPHWSKCRFSISPLGCYHSQVTSDEECLEGEIRNKGWKGERDNVRITIYKDSLTGKYRNKEATSFVNTIGYGKMKLVNCQPLSR